MLFGLALMTLALVAFVYAFQWKMLREPINDYVTEKTGRAFAINGDLQVSLGRITDVTLRQVHFANPDWAATQEMATADAVVLSVDVPALLQGRIVLDKLTLQGARINLQRSADGKRNWILSKRDDGNAQLPLIRQLVIRNSLIRYDDPVLGAAVEARINTDEAAPVLPTRFTLSGTYKHTPVSATAAAGSILSLQDSATLFPAKLEAKIGATSIKLDGTLADLIKGGVIDAKLALAGKDLSQLYPIIPVVLPSTPAYRINGHLKRNGKVYRLENFDGVIGKSDIHGTASYAATEPPILKMALKSQLLDLADLGPLIGLKPQGSAAQPLPSTGADDQPRKLLPSQPFRLERLKAMNADVTLVAGKILRPSEVPLEDMRMHLLLENGLLRMDPLEFGFSGGKIAATLKLDARQDPIASQAHIDLRNVKLQKILPKGKLTRAGIGTVGAQIRLSGQGNTVAAMLATADGEASLAMSGGELSGLLLEAINLNGTGILKYLAFGDQTLPNRCSAASFDVKNGLATSRSMVFDTAISNIQGEGQIDFRQEQLDLRLVAKPKEKSIFVARTPIHIQGPFAKPRYSLEAGPLLARGGAAAALSVLNPLAAVLALIETGPGRDANCAQLMSQVAQAQREAKRSAKPSDIQAPTLDQ
ncbi:MAG TPA: AsmA family protein [Rhodocyclaceae bacterium]|nr:AsmA family protein [Rhodocyclaceae bacterium]